MLTSLVHSALKLRGKVTDQNTHTTCYSTPTLPPPPPPSHPPPAARVSCLFPTILLWKGSSVEWEKDGIHGDM